MATCKIDVRFTTVDGTFDLEVWCDGIVTLKLAVPNDKVDLMMYTLERRRHMVLSDCLGRWLLDANDGPLQRHGR